MEIVVIPSQADAEGAGRAGFGWNFEGLNADRSLAVDRPFDVKVALDFLGRRFLERLGLLDDPAQPGERGHAFVDLRLDVLEKTADVLADLGGAPFFLGEKRVQGFVVQVDPGHQSPLLLEDQRLLDGVGPVDDRFDDLGVDVLPARPDDHVFRPALDVQESVGVQASQVAGFQPAVGEGFGGFFGILVVTLHDHRTAELDFSFARLGIGIGDPDLHALERPAGGPGPGFKRLRPRDQGRRFRQSVADAVGETRFDQEILDVGGQGRPADAEHIQFPAERRPDFRPGLADDHLPQRRDGAGHPDQGFSPESGKDLGPDHFFDDQGNGQDEGRLDRPEGGKQHRGRRRLVDVRDRSPLHQARDQSQGAFIDVGQGEERQQAVLAVHIDEAGRGQDIADEVPVGEHDALGMPGRSRSVDDRSEVLGLDLRGDPAQPLQGHRLDLAEFVTALGDQPAELVLARIRFDHGKIVDQDPRLEVVEGRLVNLAVQLLGDKDGLGLGMPENVMDFRRTEIRQDRHGDGAHGGDGQVGDAPVGTVLAEDGDPVAVDDSPVGQEGRDLIGFILQLPVAQGGRIVETEGVSVFIELRALGQNGRNRQLVFMFHVTPRVPARARSAARQRGHCNATPDRKQRHESRRP